MRQPFQVRTTTESEALIMDHLVTMTTHTPAGTREHSTDESDHG